jgi:hypothetical protein
MGDAYMPVNVRQGEPHERGLVNFLISLLRAAALLIILEYLLNGGVRGHPQLLFDQFRSAEKMLENYDQLVWSLRKTELLSSMGLILAPLFYEDNDGIVLFTSRVTG